MNKTKEYLDAILKELVVRPNKVPVAFDDELSLRHVLGISDHVQFSDCCHYLESEGYVNYVKSNGLQITDNGIAFIKNGGYQKLNNSKTTTEEQTLKTSTVISLDFIDRIKVLFGRRILVDVNIILPQLVNNYNATSSIKIISKSKSNFSKELPDYGYTDAKDYSI